MIIRKEPRIFKQPWYNLLIAKLYHWYHLKVKKWSRDHIKDDLRCTHLQLKNRKYIE